MKYTRKPITTPNPELITGRHMEKGASFTLEPADVPKFKVGLARTRSGGRAFITDDKSGAHLLIGFCEDKSGEWRHASWWSDGNTLASGEHPDDVLPNAGGDS